MKKFILSLVVALFTIHSFAQADIKQTGIISVKNNTVVPFRLFPTQNMWTFIKLNTRTGQMWQVQFDIKEDNRFVTNLSSISLVTKEKEINDRFTLYSTQNIYTFILIDQYDGRTWQVQWAMEQEKRGIIPIE